MTKIKLNWAYAKGELDTDTLKLICLPARGKRLFKLFEFLNGVISTISDYITTCIICIEPVYKVLNKKPFRLFAMIQ